MPKDRIKINEVEWETAKQVLESLLPSCREFTPDAIAKSAQDLGVRVHFDKYDGNWELAKDASIMSLILPSLEPDEKIVIISEASFTKSKPFEVAMRDLDEFIAYHRSTFDECVVNGDVIAIVPDRKVIGLFHHEGYFATVEIDKRAP